MVGDDSEKPEDENTEFEELAARLSTPEAQRASEDRVRKATAADIEAHRLILLRSRELAPKRFVRLSRTAS